MTHVMTTTFRNGGFKLFFTRFQIGRVALVCLMTPSLYAAPQLGVVFPLSCQIGQETEVQPVGKNLENVTGLIFSCPKISAQPTKGGKFLVRVAADATPQDCDVWCIADGQLSNPRRFVLTRNPSAVELTGNTSSEMAQPIAFPGAVDGRLQAAAEIDWYQFAGQEGDQLSLACRSRTLDGAVEPDVALIGPGGRVLARSDGRRRESLLSLALPVGGMYRVRISDRAYRKSDHGFYRLELSKGPFVVGGFPNLLDRTSASETTLFGFGLESTTERPINGSDAPSTQMPFALMSQETDAPLAWQPALSPWRQVYLPMPATLSGFPTASFADRPLDNEQETQTESQTVSQLLSVPTLVNGRFAKPGDVDWYSFKAKKDQRIRVEVYGDRLGSPMDLDATILNPSGKLLTTFPDAGKLAGVPPALALESFDVSAEWTAPADGLYFLVVRDLFGNSLAGLDRSYVLSLQPASPSFRVFVVPEASQQSAGPTIPQAGYAPLQLFVQREGKFAGAIQVTLDETQTPSGVSLEDCWIGPGANSALAMLHASPDATTGPQFLKLKATSQIGEGNVETWVDVATPLGHSNAAGRLVSNAALLISEKPSAIYHLENPGSPAMPGTTLRLMLEQKHLEGAFKSEAQVAFPLLPPEFKSAPVAIKPGEKQTELELKIPAKLLPGKYTLAASVRGTMLLSAQGKEKANEKPFLVWTNPVMIDVAPSK